MEQVNIRSRVAIILIVTALLVLSYMQSGVRLGQDLQGGTVLRFSLDIDAAIRSGRVDKSVDRSRFVSDTIRVIEDRINKYGLSETTLTAVGENKFEISLPAGSDGETAAIVNVVTSLGDLAFRIQVTGVANTHEDRKKDNIWTKGLPALEAWKKQEFTKYQQDVREFGEYQPGDRQTKAEPYYLVLREGREGTTVSDFAICEIPIKEHTFDGRILTNPRMSVKERTNEPVVVFDVKTSFQNVFGQWTGANIGFGMAIILNQEFTGGPNAPTIQDTLTSSVQISLGSLNQMEAEKRAKELTTILQTGSLKIRPVLESRNRIGASIAGESRDRGILAIMVAFGLVLMFMLVFYRGGGVVANIALLLNLVMLIGFLAFFQAVLTLPGIAGIVLTVGMAVDANILINERVREERRLGRSLRRAVHEGYGKALSAIVDANVTSLITAAFLYTYGSGAIRGFAVTLAIGLIVSMFTAIYVTRTIFEWRIGAGGMQKLGTYGRATPPTYDWIALRRLFAPISVLGVVFGLVMFMATDKYTLYDVDFTGGYKLQVQFQDATTPDEVRKALASGEPMTVEIKTRDFEGEDQTVSTRTVKLDVGPYPDVQTLAVGDDGTLVEVKVQRLFDKHIEGVKEADQAQAFEQYVRKIFADRLAPRWTITGPAPYAAPADMAEDDPLRKFEGGMVMRVAFNDGEDVLTAPTLEELLRTKFPYYVFAGSKRTAKDPTAMPGFERLVNVALAQTDLKGLAVFDVHMRSTHNDTLREQNAEILRQSLGEYLGGRLFRTDLGAALDAGNASKAAGVSLSEPFPSQDQIGSNVAQRLKNDALVALFLSLIGIIVYIAVRFKSKAMGFAAVVCLFHDVSITLGLTAVVNSLGLVDAKINLAMVAAFLTLVGYSVNDTVVVFDRIREERGKKPTITPGIINLAINMTLTRTIRTSLTFLLVCVALFGFNVGQRNVLEGFGFLLIIGSVVGTYSTIAISSPLLLYLPWLWKRLEAFAPKLSMLTNAAQKAATVALVPVLALVWIAWWIVFSIGAFATGLVLFVPWAMSDAADASRDESEALPA